MLGHTMLDYTVTRVLELFFIAAGFSAVAFAQYSITTTGLPTATVNQPYSINVQTNGVALATACAVVSSALPAGLAIQANGTGCLLYGTPTNASTAGFALTVTNSLGQTTSSRAFVLPVFGITSSALPSATLASSYFFAFQANGSGAYEWSIAFGSLPPGLVLSASGLLSGTPQANGTYTFSLRVTNQGMGLTDSRSFTITVGASAGSQFRITTSVLPDAGLNQTYSTTIDTSGATGNLSGANGCLVVLGSLPPGISIGPAGTSCALLGVASAAGTYQFQVQASDSAGQVTPVVGFTITVTAGGNGTGLTITTALIPNGATAFSYAPGGGVFTFGATGGTGVYTWFLDSGTLPSGLSLNSNGTLTGTPTLAGSFSFTVRVVSGGLLTSFQQMATKSFVMIVTSGGLTIVETSLPPPTVGQPYSFVLHASGGIAPYRWRLGSTTLLGLALDLTSGLISGTTLTAGSYTFPVNVTDAAGAQATVAFPLQVSTPFFISTTSLPDGSPGTNYNLTLLASGGRAPYTWTISNGNLPPGLALSLAGAITGVPAANGLSIVTVLATDASGRVAVQTFTLQIGAPGPVQILTNSLPDGSAGTAYLQTLTAAGGQLPYSWSVVAGALPPGLTLSTAGSLQGTPTQGGGFSFSLQVADAIGNSTAKGFTVSIGSTGLVLSPSALTFNYVIGSVQPVAQQVNVSSSLGTGFTATANSSWLSLSPANGTTPAFLTIFVNPSGLAAGVYGGTVTVAPAGGTGLPQSIPVTLNVAATPGLTVSPSSLAFSYQINGTAPFSQNLSIGNVGGSAGFSASANGGSWLSVSPASGSTPGTVSVSITPVGLVSGVFTGAITISGAGVTRQIPVTLTVSLPAGTGSTVTLSKSALAFNYQLGGALPASQAVVVSSGARAAFSAASGASWLTVNPDVGTTPASLLISVNPVGLAPATYTSAIGITTTEPNGNFTFTLTVTLTVSSAGFPVITGVVNGASYATGAVAPGEIVAIGGTSLGPATPASLTLDASGKVATNLGGVQVLFNGYPAPLIYASDSQINAVVPYEIAGQLSLLIAVRYQGLTSVAYPLPLTASAPGVLTLNASGSGPGAIVNSDGGPNSPLQPARKGDYVTLYVTGEGQTTPSGVTGKVTALSRTLPLTPQPVLPVTVSIGGQRAAVSFVGEAPGLVSGVLQLNVQIPTNAAPGDLPVEVTVGANRSQSGVTVSIQ